MAGEVCEEQEVGSSFQSQSQITYIPAIIVAGFVFIFRFGELIKQHKTILLTVLLIFGFSTLYAQETENNPLSEANVENIASLDIIPEYPEGITAFYKYISENFKPTGNGKILVNFIVEKDGSLSDIEIVEGINHKTDKRLMKVIRKSPKWKPGSQNGRIVRVRFALTVNVNMTD